MPRMTRVLQLQHFGELGKGTTFVRVDSPAEASNPEAGFDLFRKLPGKDTFEAENVHTEVTVTIEPSEFVLVVRAGNI